MRHRWLLGAALAWVGCGGVVKSPAPADQAAALTGALTHTRLEADRPTTVTARLRVAAVAARPRARAPINVALVVDTSGSMEGPDLEQARAASAAMLDSLADGDRLAVVAFHSKAEVIVPSTELGEDERADARARLGNLRAHGTTDMAGGLALGLEQVLAHRDPAGINRVVLLGDGVPNRDASIRETARRAGEQGVTITTLGLGDHYDETLLGEVAKISGGRFRDVESSAQVAAFFGREVLRLEGVQARHASLRLQPGPGVRVLDIVGGGTTHDVTLGDLSRGEQRDVFVRLAVDTPRAGVAVELLDAVLTYDDPRAEGARVEQRIYLGARSTADVSAALASADRDVENGAALTEAAARTVEAIRMAREGRTAEARVLLERAADDAERQAQIGRSEELARKAAEMRALGSDLPAVAPQQPQAAQGHAPPRADAAAAHDRAGNVDRRVDRPHARGRARSPSPAEPMHLAPAPAVTPSSVSGAPSSAAAPSAGAPRNVRKAYDEAMGHL